MTILENPLVAETISQMRHRQMILEANCQRLGLERDGWRTVAISAVLVLIPIAGTAIYLVVSQ